MRGEEDLLRRVFGLAWIAEEQSAKTEHHPAVFVEELRDERTGGP
jgi:hypothetical protein